MGGGSGGTARGVSGRTASAGSCAGVAGDGAAMLDDY
jgi:hypothetical protein